MKKNRGKRVFFLNYHDAPYRTPVLSFLKHSGAFDEFFVADMFPVDRGHDYWKLKYEFRADAVLQVSRYIRLGKRRWHPKVVSLMRKGEYDCVVVNGYYHFTSWALLFWGLLSKASVIFVADNIDSPQWSWFRRSVEHLKIRILGLFCSKYWVPGVATRNYLVKYGGVKREAVFLGAYTMDSSKLISDFEHEKKQCSENRKKIGLHDDAMVFLMAANFLENRQHLSLVKAFAECCGQDRGMQLLLLGEGPTLETVKSLVKEKGLESKVITPGGVAFDELAKHYSVADVYLHAGWEPYSTAVVIAASLGMPLALSTEVGAVEDVLRPGANGWSFDPRESNELLEVFRKFASVSPSDLALMGKESASIAVNYTPEWAGQQFINMVDSCG